MDTGLLDAGSLAERGPPPGFAGHPDARSLDIPAPLAVRENSVLPLSVDGSGSQRRASLDDCTGL